MCFVSRPMKIVTFLRKNSETAKRVVDFPRERDTFRNKIMEIVEDFDEESHNNNGKPGNHSRILRVNPIVFIFLSCFIIFLHFLFFSCFSFFSIFLIFSFFSFSFFHFFNFSFSFIFFHFLSFSFIFFHFLCLCWVLKICFFWASISLRFLLTILM